MLALFGVTCPYCKAATYVHPPDTPDHGEAESEVECGACHCPIVVWTQATGTWDVRRRECAGDP